ncbi:FH1/FH2 domain-containing protein 3 isoform X4 [Pantherophis guttatus]|uniref:FH1/FH2 domain-containing protein 3 isoform X4 n=1 Tax=Pantherophis guttatus TaxID=94885 RepID=A0A6P9BXG6_PANGU|nr:FH1/FH2 domain-containing protein 3 isoform X4 [Pantherophis guttatus]
MATATMVCRVQFLDDTDPFNSTNFPEPTRPPLYSFREDIPLVTQLAGVHRLLKAPQKLDDCALQLSHNGTYLDLESTLAEQKDELEGFQGEFGRGKKHSIILRTQLSVRVHACIEKLYNSNGRELRRALFSLKQIFQDDKDLVHEFVIAEGLACLIKVGAEADQNYQNYILRALGQIMLYVDGMNGVINHNETIQWLYILIGSKFRLVVKTALKLLLVFVEYTESNSSLLIEAVATVDAKRGFKLWSSVMEILEEKDGLDTELLVYAMTLINKTLSGLPDQDSFYDVIDCLEELGMEIISRKHLNKKGSDLDLVEQFNIYEMTLRHEDGDDSGEPLPIACKDRRRASLGSSERRGLERRKSRRHSIQSVKNTLSAPASPCTHSSPNFIGGYRQSTEEYSENGFSEIRKVKHDPQNSDTSVISSVISQDERLPRNCRTNISNSSSSLDSVALHPFSHHSSPSSSFKVTSQNSSCVTPKTSPNVEKLPYVPYSPFHLFSYDVEEPQTAMKEKEAEEFRENRTSLGGLLTSSYRQHQESLAVERERRRQEREERLQRIEREERNKFNQNYLDKREELRQAREERYKHLEKLAAEEYEKELKNRNLCWDRSDLSLNLGGSSIPTVTIPKCASPGSTDSHEKPSASVTSCITSQILEVNASQPECEPEPEAKEETKSEQEDETKFKQGTETTFKAVKGAEVEVDREPEREEGALSEKERQNEDLNEKDNCSASSLSSASSTLEREEPEQKLSNKDKAGPCLQSIQDDDVNDQYNNILNNKRFMLDMLYAHNNLPFTKDERVKELEAKIDIKKVLNASEDTEISLPTRTSVLQITKQVKDECIKKMEIGSLENQGNVKIFAERFNSGDVAKISNLPENDFNENISEKTPLQVKTESDFIWDQLLASPRKLKIRDMDFTDLGDEDDIDILDVQISPSDALVPPPPPIPSVLGFPPPPPPLLYRCPLPPPPSGNLLAPCLSSTPQGLGSSPLPRDQANFIKKKKTIRLFWNEVRPFEWQFKKNRHCKGFLWSKLEPIKVDTAKLEHLFETKSKDLPITKKTAADGKRQEIIVLDSKRSNAINIGLTVLPHPRTIKIAILNFDEYALNKEGIEKILTMIPTEEEKQKIQEAQLANPDIPLGTAEQFLLTLSSITELTPRLQLWAFKMDYELVEKEIAEPLLDLKEGMDQLENNATFGFILSALLAIGNFLNGTNTKAFELSYLEKVPEVKDTVHKQSLLHHVCTIVVETFPDSTDLYSEIGAITRSAKVDFEQLQDNLCQMEKRCKASWDHLKAIAKHEMKSTLKQKMSEFLKDCAERIIILKIVHRRIINRFHSFLLFMGYPLYAIREINVNKFCKIISEFALEYRTTRERVLQQKQKRANHRERNKTRGKMITDTDEEDDIESGKFSSSSPTPHNQLQGLQDTEDTVEHENMKAVLKTSSPTGENIALGIRTRSRANQGNAGSWNPSNDDLTNATDNAADEIMDRIVKSATQVPSQRVVPKERKRSRANRKSIRRTLKSGLSPEEAKALGLMGTSEMQV